MFSITRCFQINAMGPFGLPVLIPGAAEFWILLIDGQRHIVQLFWDELGKVDTRDTAANDNNPDGP